MDLNKRHHNEQYLYGGTHISTLDDNSKDIKPINIKVDNSDNVLMDTSIKRVMQKNRELHKQLIQEKEKSKELEDENKSLLRKINKLKK